MEHLKNIRIEFMIKVKNTKTYKDTRLVYDTSIHSSTERPILVAEAKLVLVTEGTGATNPTMVELRMGYIKPILISLTEKIEDCIKGEQYWDGKGGIRIWGSGNSYSIGSKRILALPEHFSSQQLQDIVDGKLKDGETLLLECESIKGQKYNIDSEKIGFGYFDGYQIKLNSSNHITLHPHETSAKQCNQHCVLAVNKFGKIHECNTNGCVAKRIENNTLHKIEEKTISLPVNERGVPIIPLGLIFSIGGVDYVGLTDNKGRGLVVVPADSQIPPKKEERMVPISLVMEAFNIGSSVTLNCLSNVSGFDNNKFIEKGMNGLEKTLNNMEEGKTSLLEDAFNAGFRQGIDVGEHGVYSREPNFDEWFKQQGGKLYTREEVLRIVGNCSNYFFGQGMKEARPYSNGGDNDYQKWFEKNVK